MVRAYLVPPLAAALCSATDAFAQTQFATGRYQMPPIVTTVYDVTTGDVDRDGFADIVLGNDHDPNLILLNDRMGSFVDVTAGRLVTPFPNATYMVDLADLDGDGDLDLVCSNDHNLANRLYLNNGSGVFTDVTATNFPANADWTECQVVVDADRDGDLDLVFGNYGQDRLYLNNGAAVFADATATGLPASAVRSRWMAAGDLDNDGDADLLITDTTNLRVLLNSGTGVFANAPAGFLPVGNGSLPEIADVNRDGRMDVLLNGGRRLLLAQPAGGFSDVTATNLPTSLPATYTGTTADVDLDGDLDLLGGSLVFLNDGTGRFTDVSAARIPPNLPTRLGVLAVDDFDGDGDPDLVLPSYQSPSHVLLMNFDRQLDAPTATHSATAPRRDNIVPEPPENAEDPPGFRTCQHRRKKPEAGNAPHAPLLRVFGIDVLVCSPIVGVTASEGPTRSSHLTDPRTIARILEHLGLPTALPELAPARGPPQPELPFASC